MLADSPSCTISTPTRRDCQYIIYFARLAFRPECRSEELSKLGSDKMSAEQQRPGSALTGGLEGRGIQPRVQDHATFTSSPHLMPPPNSARRPRACVACKESKVRCKRDEERPGDSCERCVSGGRQCIVTASARNKRPRRNISNVASLETKVDALVAALKEKQAVDVEEHRVGSPDDSISGQTKVLSKNYKYNT
jgi:hypothetical protein